MARLLGRIVLILVALAAPLGICAAAFGWTSLVLDDVAAVVPPTPGLATEDPSSMAPADCAEEEDVGVEAELLDDDVDPREVLSPVGWPRVHRSDRSDPARIGRRAGAGPPLVHLDVQTPPPRS